MALFPSSPVPSHVSVPEILDPSITFETDYGYKVRRARTTRPRRRWTLDYLGVSTVNLRIIRNFLYFVRNGIQEFQWFHPTAIELVTIIPSTPVGVLMQHGMVSGMWVGVSNTPNASINGGVFPITVNSGSSFLLNGTTGAGIQGPGNAVIYLPHAIAVMSENTLPAASTIIGPERVPIAPEVYRGIYSFSLQIEEIF